MKQEFQEITHKKVWKDGEARYLCNKAINPIYEKLRTKKGFITCKNCIYIMEEIEFENFGKLKK